MMGLNSTLFFFLFFRGGREGSLSLYFKVGSFDFLTFKFKFKFFFFFTFHMAFPKTLTGNREFTYHAAEKVQLNFITHKYQWTK